MNLIPVLFKALLQLRSDTTRKIAEKDCLKEGVELFGTICLKAIRKVTYFSYFCY
jgi:hypothetical protein